MSSWQDVTILRPLELWINLTSLALVIFLELWNENFEIELSIFLWLILEVGCYENNTKHSCIFRMRLFWDLWIPVESWEFGKKQNTSLHKKWSFLLSVPLSFLRFYLLHLRKKSLKEKNFIFCSVQAMFYIN